MNNEETFAADISSSDYDGGIAIARVADGKVVKIDFLPQRIAEQMVMTGRLPASVFDSAEGFLDEGHKQATEDSEYLYDDYNDPLYEAWQSLISKMEAGDTNIHIGLCGKESFCYWK